MISADRTRSTHLIRKWLPRIWRIDWDSSFSRRVNRVGWVIVGNSVSGWKTVEVDSVSTSIRRLITLRRIRSWYIRTSLLIRTNRTISTCSRTRISPISVRFPRTNSMKKRMSLERHWKNVSLFRIYSVWIRTKIKALLDTCLPIFQTMILRTRVHIRILFRMTKARSVYWLDWRTNVEIILTKITRISWIWRTFWRIRVQMYWMSTLLLRRTCSIKHKDLTIISTWTLHEIETKKTAGMIWIAVEISVITERR